MTRKNFIKTTLFTGLSSAMPRSLGAANDSHNIKAMLLHLGFNMWCDYLPEDMDQSVLRHGDIGTPDTVLRTRDEFWRKATDRMAERGLNMLVIDLGEGLVFPSHPELAIKGSWTADKMRAEVTRLRKVGIESIPKLNFSTHHNGWMKHYHHMVSSPAYYRFCEEVIRDVAEIFGRPRFFHIGCDEENVWNLANDGYHRSIVARTKELWEHDFLHLVRTCERNGMRPWAWSDYSWDHTDFLQRCPKSVIMSNWFYDESNGGFDLAKNNTVCRKRLKNFYDLAKAGFDQIPGGTNWAGYMREELKIGADDVIGKLVKLCRRDIPPIHLKGFLMTSWRALDTPENLAFNLKAIDLMSTALTPQDASSIRL